MESAGGWTEERVELLKKLWLEGLSASQIAGVLGEGVTRNAVIGKVHRLKLTGRAKPASSAPRARATPRPSTGVRRISSGASRPSSGIASMMKSRSAPPAPMHGATALKMDPEFETVAMSLRQPVYRTFWRVTVPVCLPAILDTAMYLFVNAMTTVSGVVFLYGPGTELASVAVLNMDDAGDVAAAAAMAMMIFYTNVGARVVHAGLARWLERRTQAWRRR